VHVPVRSGLRLRSSRAGGKVAHVLEFEVMQIAGRTAWRRLEVGEAATAIHAVSPLREE
jgi:hypothetical protein